MELWPWWLWGDTSCRMPILSVRGRKWSRYFNGQSKFPAKSWTTNHAFYNTLKITTNWSLPEVKNKQNFHKIEYKEYNIWLWSRQLQKKSHSQSREGERYRIVVLKNKNLRKIQFNFLRWSFSVFTMYINHKYMFVVS